MTTVDELREVLERRAGVPDPTGMIEAAQAGAARVRRRRRITAVALAAVVAVAIPVTVAQLPKPGPLPAAPPPYRSIGEATVSMRPDPDFFVLSRQVDATGQVLTVRHRDTGNKDSGGTVTVHDPGTYDPAWLASSEKITVGGRPAYLAVTVVNRHTGPVMEPSTQDPPQRSRGSEPEGASVIGWPEPSGAWVVVGEAQSVPALRRLAESVRLGPPRQVTSPVRFGRLPDGLRLQYISTGDDPAGPPSLGFHAALGFAAADRSPAQGAGTVGKSLGDLPLNVLVLPRANGGWTELVDVPGRPQWQTIGGQRAMYLPEGSEGFDGGTAHLLIEKGKCGILISLGAPVRISYEELVRLVAGMTFADCTDPQTWVPPLS
jgi:hypothetical protein